MSAGDDRREILRLHHQWLQSNHTIDIPRMRECFAEGGEYLMFNLNGHPYYGLQEKTELWEHYRQQIDIPVPPKDTFLELKIRGDVAWLACEGVTPFRNTGEEGTGAEMLPGGVDEPILVRWRATEVYVRDDGNGNPVWKMWHYHCSPLAPEDEPRPAFGDTFAQRGVRGELEEAK